MNKPITSNLPATVITLTGAQLLQALDFIAPDRDADPQQLESEVNISFGPGHSGEGYYCYCTDYPDEGAIILDAEAADDQTCAQPAVFGNETHVSIPKSLIGAACSAIKNKRDGSELLIELRRYTIGDLSAPVAAPVSAGPSDECTGPREQAKLDAITTWTDDDWEEVLSYADKRTLEKWHKAMTMHIAAPVSAVPNTQEIAQVGIQPLSPELESILGMICYQCIPFVQAMRLAGIQIPTRAEAEQAATIHWLLGHYIKHGNNWREHAALEVEAWEKTARKEKGE